MKPFSQILFFCLLIVQPALADEQYGDWTRGGRFFDARCSLCHSIAENKFGPMLGGVYGRQAGTVTGYSYSDAMKAQNFVWDQAKLDKYLLDPSAFIPGTTMHIQVKDNTIRSDIVAYLKTISQPDLKLGNQPKH